MYTMYARLQSIHFSAWGPLHPYLYSMGGTSNDVKLFSARCHCIHKICEYLNLYQYEYMYVHKYVYEYKYKYMYVYLYYYV